MDLMKKTYDYSTKADKTMKVHLLYSVGNYVAFILKCLGLVYKTDFIEYFKFESDDCQKKEEILTPFIDAITDFRNKIKNEATESKSIIEILKICDVLRDDVLPKLGVKIEDKGKGQSSIWKFYDKDEFMKEKEKQKEIQDGQKKQKEQEAKERDFKLSTPAKEYFATLTDKYSKFNEEGVPTYNAKGGELSKEQVNKLKKDFDKHEKNHLKWKEQQAKKADKGDKKDKETKKDDDK